MPLANTQAPPPRQIHCRTLTPDVEADNHEPPTTGLFMDFCGAGSKHLSDKAGVACSIQSAALLVARQSAKTYYSRGRRLPPAPAPIGASWGRTISRYKRRQPGCRARWHSWVNEAGLCTTPLAPPNPRGLPSAPGENGFETRAALLPTSRWRLPRRLSPHYLRVC